MTGIKSDIHVMMALLEAQVNPNIADEVKSLQSLFVQ